MGVILLIILAGLVIGSLLGELVGYLLPSGVLHELFTKEFYTLVRNRLTPGGTMTMQAGMTKVGELPFFTSIHRTLREVFPIVAGYQTYISCFGTPWGFILATKKIDPAKQDVATIDRLVAD
ncbi:MAG: hypothetical protein HY216_16290, partial [Candidatus Rokubacteria bacterium]|nr:hypothetical protein [Candidatus Rokubacteria bacterium]